MIPDSGRRAWNVRDLRSHLLSLGVPSNRDVLVHCSMRRIGACSDGAATVVAAVRDVIGPDVCIVVPTQTPLNSTTSPAFLEATRGMDESARAEYEAAMEAFDPAVTPSQGMGALAEYVRLRPTAVRSRHPQTSFSALGPRAAELTKVHDLDCHLGERSPLAALYAADASVLLLGVGFDVCTAFHLAEYSLPLPHRRTHRCYVKVGGRRVWRDFDAVHLDDDDFDKLGDAYERTQAVRYGKVGNADARVMPLRGAVDFAREWMIERRC